MISRTAPFARPRRRFASICLVVICGLVVAISMPVTAAAGSGNNSPAGSKGTDTDPHVPMTAAMQAGYKIKQAKSNAFYATNFGAGRPLINTCCTTPPVSKDLPGNQQTQLAITWCGPATMSEVINGLGTNSTGGAISISQQTASNLMYTQPYDNDNDDGTAWSGINANVPSPTSHPMLDLYNYMYYGTTAGYMYQVGVPYPLGSADQSNYQSNLTWDVFQGYPVIGDAWEAAGGYYLVGHPVGLTIYHWFKIRGYWQSGLTTDYQDSESGAESLSGWPPGSVPPYSPYNTNHLLQILGGRGYIW